MGKANTRSALWAPVLGVIWCILVLGSYYLYNYAYYKEKIGVFGRFLLGLTG